ILSLTLCASFSISSAFLITSSERTFSSDLSTNSFSSTDNFSSLSVSCLRATTRSLAAFLAISALMRARASSSSPIGVEMSPLCGGGPGGTFWARQRRQQAKRSNVHTKSLNRTETSQRANQRCSEQIILRRLSVSRIRVPYGVEEFFVAVGGRQTLCGLGIHAEHVRVALSKEEKKRSFAGRSPSVASIARGRPP